MYWLFDALDTIGPALLYGTLFGAAMTVLFITLRPRGGATAAGLTLCVVASCYAFLGPRPHVGSMLLFTLTWWAVDRKRFWLMPAIFAVWANTHALYTPGLLLVGIAAITDFDRRLWLAFGLSCVALLLNPNTWQYVVFPLGIVGQTSDIRLIAEWMPVDFTKPPMWPFIAFAGLHVLLIMVRRPQLTAFEIVATFAFLLAGITTLRLIPFAAISLAALISRVLPVEVARTRTQQSPLLRHSLLVALVAMLIGAAYAPSVYSVENDTRLPVKAVREANLDGRLLNEFNWGGYLVWHGIPVFIDGRTYDLYTDGTHFTDYVDVHFVRPPIETVLDTYSVDTVLFSSGAVLSRYLQARGWTSTYDDGHAVVLRRPAATPDPSQEEALSYPLAR
jgi:hypothetical protein